MNKKILISTPFPSLDDVAKDLGISKSRQKKIENLVEGIIAADSSKQGHRIPNALGSRRRGVHTVRKLRRKG